MKGKQNLDGILITSDVETREDSYGFNHFATKSEDVVSVLSRTFDKLVVKTVELCEY